MTAPALGTLDWAPALDRPDLLADPVRAALAQAPAGWAADCWVAAVDPGLADTAACCAAYGIAPEASANCVVVTGRRGETTSTAGCLVLATDRVDVNQVVRRRLDVRKLSFAPTADAVSWTGMEHGGITPLGLPAGWPVLVDDAVLAAEWVVVGSGTRAGKIALPGRAAAALPGAEVLRLRQAAPA